MEPEQELIFAFDSCPRNDKFLCDDSNVQGAGALRQDGRDSAAKQSYLNNWLAVPSMAETRFHCEIRDLLSIVQNGNQDAAGHGSSGSASVRILMALCGALRDRGMEATLYIPTAAGRVSCGRRSTGGGGQCAAGPGRPCYFCSRQPYAVVRVQAPGPHTPPPPPPPPPQQQQQHLEQARDPAVGRSLEGSGQPIRTVELVVDPALRELFRVAPSTPEYTTVVSELPEVWVGSRSELGELAGRVCDAMMINFRSQGLDVPPWRRRSSVMARWATAVAPAAAWHQQQAAAPAATAHGHVLTPALKLLPQPAPRLMSPNRTRAPSPSQTVTQLESQPPCARAGGSAKLSAAAVGAGEPPIAASSTPAAASEGRARVGARQWAAAVGVTTEAATAVVSAGVVGAAASGSPKCRDDSKVGQYGSSLNSSSMQQRAPAWKGRSAAAPTVVVYGFDLAEPARAS